MDIICDTNIWYNIGSGQIDINEYGEFRLWATYLTIDELSRSDKLLYDNRIGEIKSTIQQIIKNQRIIFEPPFFHLLTEFIPDFQYKSIADDLRKFDFLKSIADGKELNEEDKHIFKQYISSRLNQFDLGSAYFTELISDYKKRTMLKSSKASGVNENLILSIVKTITNKDLPLNFDWRNIELFVTTLDFYFTTLIKSEMKIKRNDWYDLVILLYVRPGQKIWSMDSGLISLIKGAGLNDYLF